MASCRVFWTFEEWIESRCIRTRMEKNGLRAWRVDANESCGAKISIASGFHLPPAIPINSLFRFLNLSLTILPCFASPLLLPFYLLLLPLRRTEKIWPTTRAKLLRATGRVKSTWGARFPKLSASMRLDGWSAGIGKGRKSPRW